MGYQYKVDIAGVEYEMADLASVNLEAPLFDKLSVGNTCSAELDITFWPKSDIPKMARIVPYIMQDDGTWLQLGEFYTDTRAKVGDRLNIVAYDGMMKGEVEWVPRSDLEFPEDGLPMTDAVTEIAGLMKVEVDSRTSINPAYTIDYPANEYTYRDVLGYIAAAHAGNWIMTREGKLLLVPLFGGMPPETNYLITQDGEAVTFGGVRILE